ncbi:M48 family metallopeptidase [Acidisoma sp. S159]|uniref:tetratricopeptide repeat protein n=1 Tax=Acidisoma sp. S159 TaxID=1747225 RepID=UPI00131B5E21|nr:hypothetical protein [Acidisoma sp. S159]
MSELQPVAVQAAPDGRDYVLYERLYALAVEYAWAAHYRFEWAEASRRWQAVALLFPEVSTGPAGVARCMIERGEMDEAETYLSRFNYGGLDVDSRMVLAEIATRKCNWQRAAQLWGELLLMKPDHPGLIDGYGRALWQLNSEGAEAPAQRIVDVPIVHDVISHELVMRFQSLGENCEFGLVQRHFGAEPVELFRWSYVRPAQMVALLASEFAGIGDPKTTRISVSRSNEYFIEDIRNELIFHTFVPPGSCDPDQLLAQHCRRLKWLREKLVDDLQTSEKIFIFKDHLETDVATLFEIDKAVKAYGPNRLLCVRIEDGENIAGSARRISDTMAFGYLDKSCPLPDDTWPIAFEHWTSICRETVRLIS